MSGDRFLSYHYKYRLRPLQWCVMPDRFGNYLTLTIVPKSTRTKQRS
ncbi:MAG: hypothetical protein ACO31I_09095 [Prochlorotrichaceae cyanobacterium]